MNKGFVFDAGDEHSGDIRRPPQSPWEFSGYAKATEQEHRERKTTSIDDKIKQRLNAGKSFRNAVESDEEEDEDDEKLEESWRLKNSKHVPADSESDEEGEEGEDVEEGSLESSEDEENDVESDQDEGTVSTSKQRSTGRKKTIPSSEDEEEEEPTDSEDEEEEEPSDDDDDQPNGLKSIKGSSSDEEDEDEEETEEEDEDDDEENNKLNKKQQKKPTGSHGQGNKFFSSVENTSFNASSFLELNVSRPLVRACEALGYRRPTPIQAACIPLALSGRDICGSAVTGSGKTAAFALPILERLLFRSRRIPAIRVLIITPTRELAVQIHSMIEKLAQFTDIRCCLIVGGLSSKVQEVALRTHPDIVVATPGRMIDHLRNTQSVGLEDLAILVLDEADRLLEMGFREEIHELVNMCPSRRQTMLFSATMTEQISELIKLSLKSPVRLSADPSTQRPSTLSEEVIRVRPGHEDHKDAILLSLCSRSFTQKTIIFSGMKIEAHRLKILFGLSGLKAAELHGNLTQAQRLEALEAFRKQEVDFLIATDVAARGLDIIGVESVINFECPKDIKTYVHRVGRTARAGRTGRSVTLMTDRDRALLKAVAKKVGSKLQKRVVPSGSVESWSKRIKDMDDDVQQIIQQEREEKMMRKAEMEATKAQNMMDHEAEIFARPKKTWFRSEHEKARVGKEAKEGPVLKTKAISVNEAEEKKRKEKRKAEREKTLPRKKRRRLEAAREAAGDEDGKGASLADIAYKRAKAVKSIEKAKQEGRYVNTKAPDKKPRNHKKRREEMKDTFQADFSRSKHMKLAEGKNKRKPGVPKRKHKGKTRHRRRK